ncbi:DUF434 domain-containing protein [Anaerobaca lacustris]|uniref:DUF434 domain-containing protein n=1 Tax=Anaerobaca lacustris TaxID=3044600 RepID=A0AAW6TWT1_9BACT|nr:DUF434 domain-containing protein [Sedimentisphaerales bacterium M17dextr]
MPDKREHRGPHPSDAALFAPDRLASLREALVDFSLLRSKGYADKSALKLVGDRFALTQRQRLAVIRSACSDQQRQSRLSRRVQIGELGGRTLAIDGYNLLITIEAALSGGLIFRGRDGCFRDLASIHGTYRRVEETIPALELTGEFLSEIGVVGALWLLDSPVSNSGRLKTLIADLAREHHWPWHVRLSLNPDAELRGPFTFSKQVGWASAHAADTAWAKAHPTELPPIVVTTDSVILDACGAWTNLAAEIITHCLPETPVIDLARS